MRVTVRDRVCASVLMPSPVMALISSRVTGRVDASSSSSRNSMWRSHFGMISGTSMCVKAIINGVSDGRSRRHRIKPATELPTSQRSDAFTAYCGHNQYSRRGSGRTFRGYKQGAAGRRIGRPGRHHRRAHFPDHELRFVERELVKLHSNLQHDKIDGIQRYGLPIDRRFRIIVDFRARLAKRCTPLSLVDYLPTRFSVPFKRLTRSVFPDADAPTSNTSGTAPCSPRDIPEQSNWS